MVLKVECSEAPVYTFSTTRADLSQTIFPLILLIHCTILNQHYHTHLLTCQSTLQNNIYPSCMSLQQKILQDPVGKQNCPRLLMNINSTNIHGNICMGWIPKGNKGQQKVSKGRDKMTFFYCRDWARSENVEEFYFGSEQKNR